MDEERAANYPFAYLDWVPLISNFAAPRDLGNLNKVVAGADKDSDNDNKFLKKINNEIARFVKTKARISALRYRSRIDGLVVYEVTFTEDVSKESDIRRKCALIVSHYIMRREGHVSVVNSSLRHKFDHYPRSLTTVPIELDPETLKSSNYDVWKSLSDRSLIALRSESEAKDSKRSREALLFLRYQYLDCFRKAIGAWRYVTEAPLFGRYEVGEYSRLRIKMWQPLWFTVATFLLYQGYAIQSNISTGIKWMPNGSTSITTDINGRILYDVVGGVFWAPIVYFTWAYFVRHRPLSMALRRARAYLMFGSALNEIVASLLKRTGELCGFQNGLDILSDIKAAETRRTGVELAVCALVVLVAHDFQELLKENFENGGKWEMPPWREALKLFIDVFRNIGIFS